MSSIMSSKSEKGVKDQHKVIGRQPMKTLIIQAPLLYAATTKEQMLQHTAVNLPELNLSFAAPFQLLKPSQTQCTDCINAWLLKDSLNRHVPKFYAPFVISVPHFPFSRTTTEKTTESLQSWSNTQAQSCQSTIVFHSRPLWLLKCAKPHCNIIQSPKTPLWAWALPSTTMLLGPLFF